MTESNRRVELLLAVALLGPPVVVSAAIVLTHWSWQTTSAGSAIALAGFVFGIAGGAICVARLPINRVLLAVLVMAYVPAAGVALFFYWLYFVGYVYGDWL